jgi:histidinol dehydrogenase
VRCERVGSASEARALAPPPERVEAVVREVLDAVREEGDAAVARYTASWDTDGAAVSPAPVGGDELEAALATLDPKVRAALEVAVANVGAVAAAGCDDERDVALAEGHRVRLRDVPVRAAGIYAPGGRAPYPSSVVMGVVTARAAGVRDVAVCSPPGPDGRVHPTTLAAAAVTGATRVHPMGGAQAVAALAFATESVAGVDVIAGPGNAWVTEAKRQVFGRVGIDGLAGPSDVVVVAGADADSREIVLDLVAQAEHGPGTLVAVASPDTALLATIESELAAAPDTGAAAALAEVADLVAALAWAEDFAPEHLELLGDEAEALAPRVRAAGCVFVGAGTAFGDYVAGSNHVLPTGGAARFSSGLSARAFRRRVAEVRIGAEAATALAPAGAALARAEGFEAHARSMEARMEEP